KGTSRVGRQAQFRYGIGTSLSGPRRSAKGVSRMLKSSSCRLAAYAAALGMIAAPVAAQQQVQMIIDRGLTDDLPYTAIYPNVLQTADDGNPETILTLQYPGAPFQCDVFAVPGAPENWTAAGALEALDPAGIVATWAPAFPGF